MSWIRKALTWLVASLFILTACGTSSGVEITPPPKDLRAYLTATPSLTPDAPVVGAAETPIPTPTPFTYTVVSGDTMLDVAKKFNVSLEDLMSANPDVQPAAMAVGQVLRIPSSQQDLTGEPTPMPVPVIIPQVKCYPIINGGLWCFVLVRNDYPESLENLSAQVTLLDANGKTLASQTAISLLNILPPGKAIPLMVFFEPEVPAEVQPRVQLLTAIRLLPDDSRYLPAILQNTLAEVNWSGKTAKVSGQVSLPSKSEPAGQVWVAGVAYDSTGNVVGVRRWESSETLEAGGSLPFEFTVSSLGPTIVRVEFVVEARPK